MTTVPRTLLDVAAVVSKRRLERALNEAEVLGLTDALSVPDLLKRYPGRRGSTVLRELLRDEATLSGITQNDFHGTARAFETDRERDRLLLADGWRVMRLTWRQVRDDPAEIVADLRLLLEDGSARRRSEAPTL